MGQRLLLDTQILLWARSAPERLRPDLAEVIATSALVVSVASVWEIGIKVALGRLQIAEPPRAMIEGLGAAVLPIGLDHVERAAALPRLHGDPFDRLLVAQAMVERLTLVSADQAVLRYDVAVLRA